MIDTLHRELRCAARSLGRSPATSGAAILTLALGIGATTLLFAVADAVLWKPLPFAHEERVVKVVLTRLDTGGRYSVAYHNFLYWQERSHVFSALAAARARTFVLPSEDGGGERLAGTEVTPSWFEVAGVEPVLGRTLEPSDAEPTAASVAVLSHELWQSRFGGDPQVIGRPLTLREGTFTVVGVMPAAGADDALEWRQLWTPLAVDAAAALAKPLWGFSVLGRLAPGVELGAAREELAAVARWVEQEHPGSNQGWGIELHPIRRWRVGEVERSLWLLLAAAAAVLAIASVNVANLLLARGAGRRHELVVRRALGASKTALLRPLLLEGGILGLAGGGFGLVLAVIGVPTLVRLAPPSLSGLGAVALDGRGLATCLGISLVTGLASGLLPALRQSGGEAATLRARRATGGSDGASRRLAGLLVAAEVAVAVVVVAAAVLLAQSWEHLQTVDLGFEPEGLLTLRFELPETSSAQPAERIARYRQILERVGALPGVEAAATTAVALPLAGGQGTFELFVEGRPRRTTPEEMVTAQMVSPSYFEAMRIRLLAGRSLEHGETWDSGHSVVVNETFARRYWAETGSPAAAAIGKWVEWKSGDRGTIVGVTADVRQLDVAQQAAAEVTLAWGSTSPRQTLVVRTAGRPSSLTAAVRAEIVATVPGATIWDVGTGEELVQRSLGRQRFAGLLIAVFGLLSLLLGAVGIYGVVAQTIRGRRREIGLRIALGARPARIVALVLGSGLAPVALGLLVGSAAALAGGRLLASLLYEVSPADPVAFAAAVLILAGVGLAACALPAARALRTDPVITLREE